MITGHWYEREILQLRQSFMFASHNICPCIPFAWYAFLSSSYLKRCLLIAFISQCKHRGFCLFCFAFIKNPFRTCLFGFHQRWTVSFNILMDILFILFVISLLSLLSLYLSPSTTSNLKTERIILFHSQLNSQLLVEFLPKGENRLVVVWMHRQIKRMMNEWTDNQRYWYMSGWMDNKFFWRDKGKKELPRQIKGCTKWWLWVGI